MNNKDAYTLSKTYSAKNIEAGQYKIWEKGGYFKPKMRKEKEPFCIIMPPPNVTGILHLGHALDVTTQDTLIRYKRMKGHETLWLPGMDHAGIATQAVVEELIYKEEGKTKHQISRKDFLEKIWEWKEKHGGVIAQQQRSMGASPDWDYFMFTMDPEANQAVNHFFVKLYDEGLIYQSDYIVNWDPKLQSAISDAEVQYQEKKGALYHIKYAIKDSEEILEIATTRPETMLGDTGVAVNPNDPRFKHLIGKTAIIPLCKREIPILADSHVDLEFGTGCLKVTPGHDFNDFEIGKRHNLEIINILNKDGTLNHYGLKWQGMNCLKARDKIVEELSNLGKLVKVKEHIHQVGHGSRSKAIIEPMVSKQWFLNVQKMAEIAVSAVEKDQTVFYPKGWENTYFSWLKNPKDWCISRQLIWGHQIPVFYCDSCKHVWAHQDKQKNCPKCESQKFHQDPDVLDTWFSSGLWPMSTLGWPDKKRMDQRNFNKFFPSSVLITGHDIIFFWVARMMMMGLKETNTVPFKKVYIHALIRDKYGRKMSKSLGNGIDPLEMVEKYGADAVRFTLAAGSGYNRSFNLDPEKIAGNRNFINKIWNAFRFIHPFLKNANQDISIDHLDHHERWILSELNDVIKRMNHSLNEFRFDDACSGIYSFTYDKFCSWFIELSKKILHSENNKEIERRSTVLKYVFKKMIALIHPVTPFISEELWKHLKNKDEDLLIIHEYPVHDESYYFQEDQELMNKFIEVITSIRNLRSSVDIKPKEQIKINLYSDDSNLCDYFKQNKENFYELARVSNLNIYKKHEERSKKSIMAATYHTEIFLPLEGHVDIDQQIARLEKALDKTQNDYNKYNNKLKNEKFVENAPVNVVHETREKLQKCHEKIISIKDSLKKMGR